MNFMLHIRNVGYFVQFSLHTFGNEIENCINCILKKTTVVNRLKEMII